MLQASPLSELYKNNRTRVLHEEQAREAEERFRRDHTFKPALYHSHKAPHSGGRLALPHCTDGYKENGGQEVIPAANFTLHKQVWASITDDRQWTASIAQQHPKVFAHALLALRANLGRNVSICCREKAADQTGLVSRHARLASFVCSCHGSLESITPCTNCCKLTDNTYMCRTLSTLYGGLMRTRGTDRRALRRQRQHTSTQSCWTAPSRQPSPAGCLRPLALL